MPDRDFVDCKFVGAERWSTYCLFNTNAYRDDLKILADGCGIKAALLFMHVAQIAHIERHNLVAFRAELARDDCMNTVMADTEPKLAFHFESAEFLAAFHGVFFSLKAFLDVFALTELRVDSMTSVLPISTPCLG